MIDPFCSFCIVGFVLPLPSQDECLDSILMCYIENISLIAVSKQSYNPTLNFFWQFVAYFCHDKIKQMDQSGPIIKHYERFKSETVDCKV